MIRTEQKQIRRTVSAAGLLSRLLSAIEYKYFAMIPKGISFMFLAKLVCVTTEPFTLQTATPVQLRAMAKQLMDSKRGWHFTFYIGKITSKMSYSRIGAKLHSSG